MSTPPPLPPRPKFNPGSFFALAFGVCAITSAIARHFNRQLPIWVALLIAFSVAFVLAWEAPRREKKQPGDTSTGQVGPKPPA